MMLLLPGDHFPGVVQDCYFPAHSHSGGCAQSTACGIEGDLRGSDDKYEIAREEHSGRDRRLFL